MAWGNTLMLWDHLHYREEWGGWLAIGLKEETWKHQSASSLS